MNFTCSIEIEKPIDKVIELYYNKDTLKEWQDGFISLEPLSGIPGQVGAKSKIIYKNKKHVIELIETIKENKLPDSMTALYEHIHMVNDMTTRFTRIDSNNTKVETMVGYTKFNHIIPKIMALIMPGMFRKQSQKWLDQFKIFAEKK